MKKVLLFAAVLGILLTGCVAPAATAPAAAEPAAESATTTEAAASEAVTTTEATTEEVAATEATTETAAAPFVLSPEIAAKVAAGEPLVIRVSYHDVSNQFAPFMKKGVEQAAADFGVDAKLVGPAGPDADAQIAELETLAESGVDGLAISSVSTGALAPVINRLLEQGIPVVAYNTDNPESNRLAFAGQDLITSGKEAAKVLANFLNGEGDVLITTIDAAAQWSIDREGGARDGFSEFPGIKVLQTVNTGTDPQETYAAIENAMLANPSVKGILSLECCSTPAAGEYVKRNNLKDQVIVVGFDELPETLALIGDGYIQASVSQAPEKQTYEAVRMLVDVLNGKPITDVDTGISIIDLSNYKDYMPAQ